MSVSAAKNSSFYSIDTNKTTIPAYTTKTGTITTSGKIVIGAGTLFKSEVKIGDWMVDIQNFDELRKVVQIMDNTTLVVDSPFAGDILTAKPFRTVRSRAKQISIANAGSDTATIDGATLSIGEAVNFPKSNKNPNGSDFIDPVIVVPGATTLHVSITK